MKKRIIALFCFIFPVILNLHAQQTIKGKVVDAENQMPLVAANVLIGDQGTLTDIDGFFEANLTDAISFITISYVGYEEKEVPVSEFISGEVLEIVLALSDNILNTMIVTGSKYENRLSESTVSMEVIRPDLVNSSDTRKLDEVLDKVPGVQMIDGQANIRGGSGFSYGAGSRVMLLLDDLPALQSDAGYPNWGDLPIENIGQIEILKGAASALYGSAALNGIINIRRAAATSTPLTRASISYKRFLDPKDPVKNWWQDSTRYAVTASVVHNRKMGKLDLVSNVYFSQLESFNQQTYDKKGRLGLNLKYRLTDRATIGLNTLFNEGEGGDFFIWADGFNGAYKAFSGTQSEKSNTRIIVDPYFTIFDKKDNKHKLQLRYFYLDNDNLVTDINVSQSNSSQQYLGEYQFQRKFSEIDLLATTGVVYSKTNSDAELFGDTTFVSSNIGAYLQLEKNLGERLKLSAGGRYEFNKHQSPDEFQGFSIPDGISKDGEFISKFGANYELNEYTFIRASWGQGYRYPTITERFITTVFSGFVIFPNVALDPERGYSGEVGIKHGIKIFGYEGFLDLAAFTSAYEDMMEFTFVLIDNQPGFQSQNIGNTRINGLEISTYGKIDISDVDVNIFGGYTYLDPKYQDFDTNEQIRSSISGTENVLKYRSKHNFKIDVEARYSNAHLGFSFQRTSHVVNVDKPLETPIGDIDLFGIRNYRATHSDGYKVLDVRLGYAYKKQKLSLLFKNILNEEYTLRPGLLEAPRNVALRLDFDL